MLIIPVVCQKLKGVLSSNPPLVMAELGAANPEQSAATTASMVINPFRMSM
jgi:hypothetical protein